MFYCIIFVLVIRLDDILKRKQTTKVKLCAKLKWSPQKLNSRLKGTVTLNTLISISEALNITVNELIDSQDGYSHFYDDTTGEWLGIRKI